MYTNIISRLNWVDILLIIIIFRISYVAFQDGLSHEIFPLIGAVGAAVISLHYYHSIAEFIYENAVKLPIKFLDFLSFILLLIVTGLVVRLIRAVSDRIIKVTWHPLVEKAGGLVFGFMRSSVMASIILMIIALIPLSYLQHSIRDRSVMGMHFLRIVPGIYGKVSGLLPKFKIETLKVDREDIVQDLVSDKSVETKK